MNYVSDEIQHDFQLSASEIIHKNKFVTTDYLN